MNPLFTLALTSLLLTSCAVAPKPAAEPAATAAAGAPAPAAEPDCIAGKVSSDDDLQDVPPRVEVRLFYRGSEVTRQNADEYGYFRFDGPLNKGNYELRVRSGALHGTRALTYTGGALKNISVVIAKPDGKKHRRRHRRH